MLIARGQSGLWSGLGVTPAPSAFDPSASFLPGGGAAVAVIPEHEKMTGLDPYNPPVRNTRGMIRAMVTIYTLDVARRGMAIRGTLSTQLQTCVGGVSVEDPSIQAACARGLSPERLLLPLGIVDMLGVPFTLVELANVGEDGALEREYTPDPTQKFLAARMAYVWSQWAVARALLGMRDPSPDGFENWIADSDSRGVPYVSIDDRKKHGMLGLVARSRSSINDFIAGKTGTGDLLAQKHSANRFTAHPTDFVLLPIRPTREELEDQDGLYKYYERGGYLLYRGALDGETAIAWHELRANLSYFQCTDGRIGVVTEKIPDEGHGWLAFLKFGPAYKIRVQMKDRSTWESVKGKVQTFLSTAFNTICKVQPLAKAVGEFAVTSKVCTRPVVGTPTDAQKQAAGCTPLEVKASPGTTPALACLEKLKACKEGEPGCVCTTPPVATQQQAMIAAGSALLASVCPKDEPPALQCPPPPPKAFVFPRWALWAIGVTAVIGGAAMAARR